MFKNYLSIILRSFRRTPVYNTLNIAGLALGIGCAALIFLWVEDEVSFDQQYAKRDQLYSVRMNMYYSNRIESLTSIPGPMPQAIRTSIPEVVNLSRLAWSHELFAYQGKVSYENGVYVDTGFFSMMQPVFLKGNASGFTNPHTIVLSKKIAHKFFGDTDPVGKTLYVNNQQEYMVIGVVKDEPENVSLRYDWLMPVSNFVDRYGWLNSWSTYGINTLVELRPDANVAEVDSQLTAILRPKDQLYAKATCRLEPMTRWHLYNRYTNGQPDGGQITLVRIVSAIAWIIIIIACINFMNLATARAGQRAREVGVRKTLGALRKVLIGQFIFESLLMSFAAVILAVILVMLVMPAFNTLVDKQLSFAPFAPIHLSVLIGIGIFCGLIAGSYPALYLSSFQPVAVLKGQKIAPNNHRPGLIRKGLVVTQFAISVTLVICTVIVYEQLQYLRSRDLGYNKEHLVFTSLHGVLAGHFNFLKAGLLQTGVVANAALSLSPPLAMWQTATSEELTWPGAGTGNKIKINTESVSPEYFSTMGLQIQAGRGFYNDIKADSGDAIINQALAAVMGKDGHIGGYLTYARRYRYRIVGIVKDFVFNDMSGSVTPLMLACDPEVQGNYGFLEIRLKPGNDLSATLAKVAEVMKTNNPGYPFDYQFVDQNFAQIFSLEAHIGRFAGIFSLLAIFISCLGLFGLAAYTAERRTREIGIRKVLGASTAGLANLLSREFLQSVALACLIAFPLAWLFMNHWLKDYTYRATMHWWIFAIAGMGAFLIAWLTVTFLAIRTARANPVNSLRTE